MTLQPPLHMLRAFVATAGQGTISGAAKELHLTQGAVSKQVRELEELLGLELFLRVRGRLVLSPVGRRYLPEVSKALQLLETATLDAMTQKGSGAVLNLSTSPSFAAKWLIPRLPAFQAAHPEVILDFMPFLRGQDFSQHQLDCAIRYGEGAWPETISHYIAGREVTLIAPAGLPPAMRLKRPKDVEKHVLLQYSTVPTAWVQWCEGNGIRHPNPMMGPKLDQVTSVLRAVMAGMGIGLVPKCLVEDEIDKGLVVEPFDTELRVAGGFYLCYPELKAHLRGVTAFRDWICNLH